jgi:hypothetical protein
MDLEILSLPSFWKTDLKQRYFHIQKKISKLVVLFPGSNFPCEMPSLYYAGTTAIQCGFDLKELWRRNIRRRNTV